jgi:predicted transcriptional regulator of viral defense system
LLKKITAKPRWLLSDLHRRGLAHAIQRGRYLINVDGEPTRAPDIFSLDPLAELVLRRLDQPYYLSWHSALWHHGLLEQQSSRLLVAVTFRKRPAKVGALTLQFVTIRPRKFFGFIEVGSGENAFKVATVEKAFIDAFDRPKLTAPTAIIAESLRDAWRRKKLDPTLLVRDAIKFDSPFVNRRLGFFMELWKIPGADELYLRTGRGPAIPLHPGGATDVEIDSRWRIYRDPAIVETAKQRR